MDLPRSLNAAAAASALAAFVRARLADLGETVGDTLGPFRDAVGAPRWACAEDVQDTARQVAMVIVGAAVPFAPTSYARARLLRQLHATGLLTEHESEHAVALLELAQ